MKIDVSRCNPLVYLRGRRKPEGPWASQGRPVATIEHIHSDERGLVVSMRLTPHGKRVLGIDVGIRGVSIGEPR